MALHGGRKVGEMVPSVCSNVIKCVGLIVCSVLNGKGSVGRARQDWSVFSEVAVEAISSQANRRRFGWVEVVLWTSGQSFTWR